MDKLIVVIVLLAGCFVSCEKIDMSKIDFSNIEDLYAQPLPVIQECVQGKWKWYASYGGFVGISYPDSTFIDIRNDHYIITDKESQDTIYFTWEKYTLPDNKTTWVVWDKELDRGIWAFDTIKNDTLGVASAIGNEYLYYRVGSSFIRVK